jgi:hypothetical protein
MWLSVGGKIKYIAFVAKPETELFMSAMALLSL